MSLETLPRRGPGVARTGATSSTSETKTMELATASVWKTFVGAARPTGGAEGQ
ncbi:MAG: hypothetical protein ABSF83_05475 [Nitrososphaerales archaeon]